MVTRTVLAYDNDSLTVDPSSPSMTPGNPVINNGNSPNGTIYMFSSGSAATVTIDDADPGGAADVFNDGSPGTHTIIDGNGLVPNGTPVESESRITIQQLDDAGNLIGPPIDIYVFSQNGNFGDIWGYATSGTLIPGARYEKVGGSNNGSSLYSNFAPCFAKGTRIRTQNGSVPVEQLQTGDLVYTLNNGFQKIAWIGATEVTADPNMAPICFDTGVMGNDAPLLVSPCHRMYVADGKAELVFGAQEALIEAKHFVGQAGVSVQTQDSVTYYHFMFDQHQIVEANGALSESFYPGDMALSALDEDAKAEIYTLFPELRSLDYSSFGDLAAYGAKSFEASAYFAQS